MTERRAGPDHSLYAHSPRPGRTPLRWPSDARIALGVFLYFEYWEFDPPKRTIYDKRHDGALGGLFPNYKVHSQFEYGNRVGIVRVLDLFDRHGLPVTVAANAGACEKYPYLVDQFRARGYEFAAHGAFATRMLSSAMSEGEERAAIAHSLDMIERATGTRPRGWIGQDYGESTITPRLLAEAGLRYVADWGNDDQPYLLNTTPPLVSVPNQAEWDDVQMIWHRRIHPSVWRDTALEAFAQLRADGADSATMFGLHIHPWLAGQPHRIGYLEAVVEKVAATSHVWRATAGALADHIAVASSSPSRA
jgi:peptidoglycan/xylan/chitin deacetylase (PgdA/CDA1 family)